MKEWVIFGNSFSNSKLLDSEFDEESNEDSDE